MDAEYIAASEAAKEAVWLKNFLSDMEVVPNTDKSITPYCDNSGTVETPENRAATREGRI